MRRLSYDDHVLLNNYVDHHLFTFVVNSGYSPMKYGLIIFD